MHPDKYELESITVLQPDIVGCIYGLGLIGFLALFLLAAICVYRRSGKLVALLAMSASLAPVAVCAGFFRDPAPWRIHNEIRSPDGTKYCFAESSFLQGQTLVLGRSRGETFWTRTVDVLVWTGGDSPRSYLRIVRPAGVAESYGQVLFTDDGWLLGLRSENRCFFAYDTNSGRPYGYRAVEDLSPFLALDGTAELHGPDVENLVEYMGQRFVGIPTAYSLRKGLDHPNPRVRALAAQLLGQTRSGDR